MSKKNVPYTKKELLVWVWFKVMKNRELFAKEFMPQPVLDEKTKEPKIDEDGFVIMKMSDTELQLVKDPTIVRTDLLLWNVNVDDYLAIGCDKWFDPDMVDYIKCDPVVLKKEVWQAFCDYEHKRKLARRRYAYLKAQSREKFLKVQREGKKKGEA